METTNIWVCERCGEQYEQEVETCETCLCMDFQILEVQDEEVEE